MTVKINEDSAALEVDSTVISTATRRPGDCVAGNPARRPQPIRNDHSLQRLLARRPDLAYRRWAPTWRAHKRP